MHLTTLDTFKCNHTGFVPLSLVYYANMAFKTNPGRWEEREAEGRGQIHLPFFSGVGCKGSPLECSLRPDCSWQDALRCRDGPPGQVGSRTIVSINKRLLGSSHFKDSRKATEPQQFFKNYHEKRSASSWGRKNLNK